MPIYEYACQTCGHDFEALVRSDTVPACPSCHSTDLAKKLSVFATAMATAESASAAPALPAGCGACGHPGGPGACGMG